jgi:hypothetical protein
LLIKKAPSSSRFQNRGASLNDVALIGPRVEGTDFGVKHAA